MYVCMYECMYVCIFSAGKVVLLSPRKADHVDKWGSVTYIIIPVRRFNMRCSIRSMCWRFIFLLCLNMACCTCCLNSHSSCADHVYAVMCCVVCCVVFVLCCFVLCCAMLYVHVLQARSVRSSQLLTWIPEAPWQKHVMLPSVFPKTHTHTPADTSWIQSPIYPTSLPWVRITA
jgi:hypothetical protein